MDIDKKELSLKFKEGDWDYVFKEAQIIADFILVSKFKVYDQDIRSDMTQDCLENLYKKILANKVNPDKNLFAFIWTNSRLRILEILRKEKNRKRIAKFTSYQNLEGLSNYIDYEVYMDNRSGDVLWK